MSISRVLLVAGGTLLLAACGGGDKGTGPKPGETVITKLSCAGGSGGATACTIPLTGASSFTIETVSTDCEARGNILRITSPSDQLLSEDACNLAKSATKEKWTFPGPFNAAAVLNMSVTAKYFDFPPSLRVTEEVKNTQWRVVFEDGYDTDYNDVILRVVAAH
jgi:hypothetical protein